MRAYYLAALALCQIGCRDLVRELLKEDQPGPSAESTGDPVTTATATATATAVAKKSAAPPAVAPTVAPTCANVCEKSLKCMNAYNAQEQSACVTSCEGGKPDPVKFAKLLQIDCKTLTANLKGGGNGSGGSSGKSPQAEPCGASHCSTCVWDGSSCYSRVPPYLACDACCCRPGGPAPRWD